MFRVNGAEWGDVKGRGEGAAGEMGERRSMRDGAKLRVGQERARSPARINCGSAQTRMAAKKGAAPLSAIRSLFPRWRWRQAEHNNAVEKYVEDFQELVADPTDKR